MTEPERRTEIIEAVERLLYRGGVNAVTMRAVAAEAGVSLRLVQYYGSTKDELLGVTLDRLADKSVKRWQARTQRQGGCQTPLAIIKAFFDEALPTDPESEGFHRLGVSLEMLSVTDSGTAGRAYQKHLAGLADHLTCILQSGGPYGITTHHLALEMMGLAHGVGALLMAGQLSALDANTLVENYLARLEPQLSP